MKLIPKLQQGGKYTSLFANFNVLNLPEFKFPDSGKTLTSKDPSGSKESKGRLSEEDLFKTLNNADLLPNEMQSLVTNLNKMYDNVIDDVDFETGNSSKLSKIYSRQMLALKQYLFNKAEYDKAYKIAEENQGLNELAITTSGKIVAYNKNKELDSVSISEYLKNPNEYLALTASNLLWLRAHDPQYINNNQIFDIVQNAMGISQAEKIVSEKIHSLGTTESSSGGYVAKKEGKILQGLLILEDAAGKQLIQEGGLTVDGLYKTKIITKDQKQLVEAALDYIYKSLPENVKGILAVKSGNSENPQKGAFDMITNMVVSRTSSYRSIDSELQENLEIDGTKKEKSSKDPKDFTDIELNTASQFLAGYGQRKQLVINPGTNLATVVNSNSLPINKKDGTPLGANSTLQELTQGQFSGILDYSNVTMGGRKIDPNYFNLIILSDGVIHSVDFPCDENGNPDLRPTTLEKKKKAERLLSEAGIDINDKSDIAKHSDEVNLIMQEVGLSAIYNQQGDIVGGNYKRFAVFNATADNRVLGVDPLGGTSQSLREVTDDHKIDTLLSVIADKSNSKVKDIKFDKKDAWIFEGDYDMFLEGTLWIPVNENYFNAQAGSGEKISGKIGNQMYVEQEVNDKRKELLRSYNKANQPE